jgi:hypothetical protein
VNFKIFELAQSSKKRPAYKSVLMNLAFHDMRGTGEVWPSVATLASETGFCERAVTYALRELETDGVIVSVGGKVGGRFRSTHYILTGANPAPDALLQIANPAPSAPFENANPAPDAENPAPDSRKGAPDSLNPAPHAPEVVREVVKKLEKKERGAIALPLDFQPNPEHQNLAKERNINFSLSFANFKDWHKAQGTQLVDWNAALCKWLRGEKACALPQAPAQMPNLLEKRRKMIEAINA